MRPREVEDRLDASEDRLDASEDRLDASDDQITVIERVLINVAPELQRLRAEIRLAFLVLGAAAWASVAVLVYRLVG